MGGPSSVRGLGRKKKEGTRCGNPDIPQTGCSAVYSTTGVYRSAPSPARHRVNSLAAASSPPIKDAECSQLDPVCVRRSRVVYSTSKGGNPEPMTATLISREHTYEVLSRHTGRSFSHNLQYRYNNSLEVLFSRYGMYTESTSPCAGTK